jgi:uncharacterized protein
MSTRTFVNLRVRDLTRSSEFFTGLGFSFDQRFTDENAGCLVIGDDIYVMLVTEPFFRAITTKKPAGTATTAEAIMALEVGSRERVDELAGLALASGGSPVSEPAEHEGMYERSFADPDGHLWEVFCMDTARVPAGQDHPGEAAAAALTGMGQPDSRGGRRAQRAGSRGP